MHKPSMEWDEYGRIRSAPCLCDACEGRRLWGAIVLLLIAASTAIGLVVVACRP